MVKNIYKKLSTKFVNKKMSNCCCEKDVNDLFKGVNGFQEKDVNLSTVNNSVKQMLTTLLTLF